MNTNQLNIKPSTIRNLKIRKNIYACGVTTFTLIEIALGISMIKEDATALETVLFATNTLIDESLIFAYSRSQYKLTLLPKEDVKVYNPKSLGRKAKKLFTKIGNMHN